MRIEHKTKFLATHIGRGEFYSGIERGEKVVLTANTVIYNYEGHDRSSTSLSIQKLSEDSAHLGVRLQDLADISPYIEKEVSVG